MTVHTQNYIERLIAQVYQKVQIVLQPENDESLIERHFVNYIKHNTTNNRDHFKRFQEFYFTTLNKKDSFNFHEFRQWYSLQGVTGEYLDRLEARKAEIVDLIYKDDLATLYFGFFSKNDKSSPGIPVEKNFGSFFTKVAHTFNPEKYTAIDNPIKEYFGLKQESYFITMIVISMTYKKWAEDNRERMEKMRELLRQRIEELLSFTDQQKKDILITDMKLMNLIFWSVANDKGGGE